MRIEASRFYLGRASTILSVIRISVYICSNLIANSNILTLLGGRCEPRGGRHKVGSGRPRDAEKNC